MPETNDPKREAQLDALLNTDTDEAPRPGFDTRFFARLEEAKAEEAQAQTSFWERLGGLWPWLAGAAVATAAVALVMRPTVEPERTGVEAIAQADIPVALEMELLEEFEVIEKLDELEAYAVLAELDLEEVEAEAIR